MFDLKGARTKARLTQAQLAEHVGVPPARIGRLEKGVGDLRTLAKVATVLGTKLPDLRTIRLQKNISARELARQIGVTHPVVHHLERGRGSVARWRAAVAVVGNERQKLTVRPCELADANAYIVEHHRHHRPVQTHRFSIKAVDPDGNIQGVAICNRPAGRMTDSSTVLEVSRLCTNGAVNAPSMLYAAAARIAATMGYRRIQTFTLEHENGVSLKAAGWVLDGVSNKANWHSPTNRTPRVHDNPGVKHRWAKILAT